MSDAFFAPVNKIPLELTVKVFNINKDKKSPLLKKSTVLSEYSAFVKTVRHFVEKDPQNGYTEAIKACMKNNILKEYLMCKSKEVNNMLEAEYDHETDIAIQCEESFEQGDFSRMMKTIENMRRKN